MKLIDIVCHHDFKNFMKKEILKNSFYQIVGYSPSFKRDDKIYSIIKYLVQKIKKRRNFLRREGLGGLQPPSFSLLRRAGGPFGPYWGPSAPPFPPPPKKIQKKSKMAAMVPKWLPVIDMGVISLSSEFQHCSSSNG